VIEGRVNTKRQYGSFVKLTTWKYLHNYVEQQCAHTLYRLYTPCVTTVE